MSIKFEIWQLKRTPEGYKRLFISFEQLKELCGGVDKDLYEKVYEGERDNSTTADDLFREFNIERPANFTGHSLSVSDIVVIYHKDSPKAEYVNDIGWADVTADFLDTASVTAVPYTQVDKSALERMTREELIELINKLTFDCARAKDLQAIAASSSTSVEERPDNADVTSCSIETGVN